MAICASVAGATGFCACARRIIDRNCLTADSCSSTHVSTLRHAVPSLPCEWSQTRRRKSSRICWKSRASPATSSAGAGRGAFLSFAYSIGLGIPFIVAAFSVSRAMTRLQWARRHASTVMLVGGLVMVVLGVLQVSGLWLDLMTRLQGVVANWQTPI